FFFQAEDGIRDRNVTGVQTCALPILHGIEDTELRMTFDFNLQCRNYDLLLEHGPYGKQFIDPDLVVLEVKVNDSVPLWLTRILQELDCKQRSASKFCTSLE